MNLKQALACSVFAWGVGLTIPRAQAQEMPSGSDMAVKKTVPKKNTTSALSDSILGQNAVATEMVTVTGKAADPNGVTNQTPGGGLMPHQSAPRSQSGITRDFIAKQSPTANITSLIGSLPGVTVANTDPFGTTPDRLMMHGMNQTQIGYLFEGNPLADPITYQPNTSTFVDTENLGSVTVSQGAPDLNAPFYNATGGQVSAREITPASKKGGFVDVAGGSHSLNKEFMRLQTGSIGASGIRGFVSFSHLSNNNWRGPGGQKRYHVDAKFVKRWEDSDASIIFGYNRQEYTAFRSPNLVSWKKYGVNYNYQETYFPGNSAYYKLNRSNQNLLDVLAPVNVALSDEIKLHVSPYVVRQEGPQASGENIPASGGYFGVNQYGALDATYATNGKLTTQAIDPWYQLTGGLNTSVDWTIGHNILSFGYWYAYTTHTEEESFSPVNFNGVSENAYGKYPINFPNGKLLSGFNLNYTQQVNSLFIADTLRLLNDRVTLSAGFRTAMLARQETNDIPGADPYKNGKNYFEPMPQFGANYQITSHDQVFINGTTSFRAPQSVEAYSQIFDPNSPHAIQQPSNLKPEYSIAEEIGYRHQSSWSLAISAFNINMTNHQVTSAGYLPGTNQIITTPINVGGQTSRGIQAEFAPMRWHHVSPYISGQYLYATMNNDFNAGVDYLQTKGKVAVASPHFSAAVGIQYDDGHVFGDFNFRYIDRQYSTFINDESIPSYVTSDITLGYRCRNIAFSKSPTIQLNLVNVGNSHYLSGPSSFTGTATTRRGIYGNTITGSSPSYLVGATFAAVVSMSSGF